MKPPLRTSLRISAESVDGALTVKNYAVVCDGNPLRVEVLDAVIIGRSGSVTGTALASILEAGCSVIWEGKSGVLSFTPSLRDRSAGFAERQAECFALKTERLASVRRMMSIRFGEPPPKSYTENEIRGWEGLRMARLFKSLAREHGLTWNGRDNDPRSDFQNIDPINRALSSAFAVLYREVHLAVLVMGMSPALGFLHRSEPRSFVYDMADIYKNDLAVEVFATFADGEYVERSWIADLVRENFVKDMRMVLWG